MYCPKCGKPQASDGQRFCARCGLALEGVNQLVESGSASAFEGRGRLQLSPRAKGVLQGVAIVPTTVGALLVLDIFYESVFNAGMMGGLYATLTLILLIALARILYALFLEEGPPRRPAPTAAPHAGPDEINAPAVTSALPAATGETVTPSSIAENTTRQLETRRQ